MQLAAVFLLSLLGGYAFANRWRRTRYAIRRHDGQHVYLRSALYGTLLFISSFALHSGLIALFPAYQGFEEHLASPVAAFFDNKPANAVHVLTAAIYSLLLGPLIGSALNRCTSEREALLKTASSLELLMHDAIESAAPVMITLENGKCYVGMVLATWNPDHLPQTIKIFPMLSGQRDEQGRVNFTTDYENIYVALTDEATRESLGIGEDWPEQFELTIRADKILTATPFSPAIYGQFNPKWAKQDIDPQLEQDMQGDS
ncbi:MAG: hypothetical protein AB7N70_09590 [Dehalococcoidia bacterium]